MAWYYGTYVCGHEGRVNIIGPVKHRQWKADRSFEEMCPDCYEKYLEEKRNKANKESAEKAKEMELPMLEGTEKQIAWANTIRQNIIEKFEKLNEEEWKHGKVIECDLKKINFEDVPKIQDYILRNRYKASYWIDNRNRFFGMIITESKEALKTEDEIIEEKQALNIKSESTIFPENAITNVVAEITISTDKVTVIFEKNDKFRQIVKNLRYSWNGAWERKINQTTGDAADRAAELGNKLLNAGFPICILDEGIRRNAINGEYELECNRWILLRTKGEYEGRIVIKWYDKSDLYDKARKLPGSKWDSGVVVRVEHYKEIEDFASLYEFKFTSAALEAIEKYKEQLNKTKVIKPNKVEKVKPKDGLAEILNSGSDIIDDLKD